MFSGKSPFNQKILDPAIDLRSRQAISALLGLNQGININTGSWTPTVYYVSRSLPTSVIRLEDGRRLKIPIPANAVSSNDSDGHAEIVDRNRGCAYDFSDLARSAAGWTAKGGAVFRLNGTGVHEPWAIRASGFSLGAGLIRPADVRAGVIRHALVMAIPLTSPGFVTPATTSDGRTAHGLPMGSHLQLDPSFNVRVLPPTQRPLARAMQEYGIFVGDTSSSLTLYAQNDSSVAGFHYPASWSNGLSHGREILARLRLLKPTKVDEIDASPLRACR